MSCVHNSCRTSRGLLSYLSCAGRVGSRSGLFIHGLGCDGWWFPAQHEEQDLGFLRWVVPDLLGHGASEAPAEAAVYAMESQAGALAELVAHEAVDELVLVAHSMGGPVALHLAELLGRGGTTRVAGVVYAEGNLDPNDAFLSRRVADQPWETFVATGWPELLAALARAPNNSSYLQSLSRTGPWAVWASSVSLVAESREEVTVPLLDRIAAPKLFLFGERNRGSYTSEAVAARCGEVAYVPEAGHAMAEDNPAAFWRLVREFCARLP
jgi:pimeloyl-ACP methyl ester carboxylesterase